MSVGATRVGVGLALLAALACRPVTHGLAEKRFACVTAADCLAGQWCVAGGCSTEPEPPRPVEAGAPPTVLALEVTNGTEGPLFGTTTFAAGDVLRVDSTVTDDLGLAEAPLTLQYTTDNLTWRDLRTHREVSSAGESWFGVAEPRARTLSGALDLGTAPAATYFRLRLIARDAANQRSAPLLSDLLNVPRWRFYAGHQAASRAVGLAPERARMFGAAFATSVFIVHPVTGDLYAFDFGAAGVSLDTNAVYKLDVRTQEVSLAFKLSSSSGGFSDGARLEDTPTLLQFTPLTQHLKFDTDGRLFTFAEARSRPALYELDLDAGVARLYLGGGTSLADAPTPAAAALLGAGYAFDAANALYYFAPCAAPNQASARLMKASRTIDDGGIARAGTVRHVAGSCTGLAPVAGTPAVDAALAAPTGNALSYLKVVPVDDRLVYVHHRTAALPLRLLDGVVYPVALPTGAYSSLGYNRVDDQLYAGASGIVRFAPSHEAAANPETFTTVAPNHDTGDCTRDGRSTLPDATEANWACINTSAHVDFTPTGDLLFSDDTSVASVGTYRIRRLDADGGTRTVLGSPRFDGDGADRGAARSAFSGIWYKPASAPNQQAFPEGLYFVDAHADVLGRIEPATHPTRPNRAVILGGNMSNLGGTAAGAPVTTTSALRYITTALAFDDDGLPVFSTDRRVASIDPAGRMVYRTSYNGSISWTTAASGAGVSFTAGTSNLTPTSTGFFVSGTDCSFVNGCLENPMLRWFPRSGPAFTVIGGTGRSYTADISTPQNVQSATLSDGAASSYRMGSGILQQPFMSYDPVASPPRLYFVEGQALRYVTNPLSSNTNGTLRTLLTSSAGIGFFTFNPAGGPYPARSMVFFLSGDENVSQLYCQANPDVPGAAEWCPPRGVSLGPGGFATDVALAPNGMSALTWRSPTALLVRGLQTILEFDAR